MFARLGLRVSAAVFNSRRLSSLPRQPLRVKGFRIWAGRAAGLGLLLTAIPLTVASTGYTVQAENIDPETSIEFPSVLKIPARVPYPPFTLIGVGVRKVSFLRVKVYSVALYADLTNPNLKVSTHRCTSLSH